MSSVTTSEELDIQPVDIAGRWKIVSTLTALPGECFFCGSSDRKFYLETGIDVEFVGALYICLDECVREFANVAGFLSAQQSKSLRETNVTLSLRVEEQTRKIVALERVVDELRNANSIIVSSDDITVDSDGSDSANEADVSGQPDGTQEELRKGPSELSTGEGETPESSNDEGVGELRSSERSTEPIEFEWGI